MKPKPIQIRLPKDIEDALRLKAFQSKKTINSIVIDCLTSSLETVTSKKVEPSLESLLKDALMIVRKQNKASK